MYLADNFRVSIVSR